MFLGSPLYHEGYHRIVGLGQPVHRRIGGEFGIPPKEFAHRLVAQATGFGDLAIRPV